MFFFIPHCIFWIWMKLKGWRSLWTRSHQGTGLIRQRFQWPDSYQAGLQDGIHYAVIDHHEYHIYHPLIWLHFRQSILRQANFKGAKLLGASFFDADLTGLFSFLYWGSRRTVIETTSHSWNVNSYHRKTRCWFIGSWSPRCRFLLGKRNKGCIRCNIYVSMYVHKCV